jgi:hypothetical protein
VHYNYHRPHTTAGNQPPATRLHTGVTNVMTSYITVQQTQRESSSRACRATTAAPIKSDPLTGPSADQQRAG